MSNLDKPKISKFGKTFISYGSYHYDNTYFLFNKEIK